MTDSSMPNSAQEWADFLNKKSLSSPFRVGEFALKKLGKETLSYAEIAKIINKDPILSLKILTRVNKESQNMSLGSNEGSKTLTHAISMLGLEEFKDCVHNLPKKAISPKNITSFYYLRTLSNSLFAGHLAKAISVRKKKGNAEDIYWSGLFLGAPTWYLWRFATPEMRLTRYAIRSNFKLPRDAETEVFGDTLKNITRAMAKTLMLPKLAQECFDPLNQPSLSDWVKIAHCVEIDKPKTPLENRELKILIQKPHFIVLLSNLIAHYASFCWYSRATLRAQRILAYYLDCPLEEAISFTHAVAADMSQQHPLPGLMLPAAKLFVPPRKRTKAQKHKSLESFQESTFDTSVLPSAVQEAELEKSPLGKTENQKKSSSEDKDSSLSKSSPPSESTIEDSRSLPEHGKANASTQTSDVAKETQTAKQAPIQEKNSELFDELTQIMSQHPEEFTDFHELMNAATQGISYGIKLKRSFVTLISKDKSRLKTYYTVGCTNYPELKNFESKIVSNTIFEKLCERPASVWLKPSSDKKIRDLLPMNFKTAVDTSEFLLMSVFAGKQPVAIFYADNLGAESLTQRHYQQFKFLCGAVSSALQYQAKQSKTTSSK